MVLIPEDSERHRSIGTQCVHSVCVCERDNRRRVRQDVCLPSPRGDLGPLTQMTQTSDLRPQTSDFEQILVDIVCLFISFSFYFCVCFSKFSKCELACKINECKIIGIESSANTLAAKSQLEETKNNNRGY